MRMAWLKDTNVQNQKMSYFLFQSRSMYFFVKDRFVLPFYFWLLSLKSTEDEGKLYGKYTFLEVEARVRPGFSWSHLAEISKSAFFPRKCSLFRCYWSVCYILLVENWVGGIGTTQIVHELLGYCKLHMYVWVSSDTRVFSCVLLCYKMLNLLCWDGDRACTLLWSFCWVAAMAISNQNQVIFSITKCWKETWDTWL